MPLNYITPYATSAAAVVASTLLMHMDGADNSASFPDEKSSITFAASNTRVKTTDFKFGTASAYFNGNSYLQGSKVNILGGGDFTLECWIKPAALSGQQTIFAADYDINLPVRLYMTGAQLVLYLRSSGANIFGDVPVGTIPNTNWTHIAFTKVGPIYSIYINGTRTWTANSAGIFDQTAIKNGPVIGSMSGIYFFTGYMDEFRVVKGTGVTSGVTYPMPSAPYTG